MEAHRRVNKESDGEIANQSQGIRESEKRGILGLDHSFIPQIFARLLVYARGCG